MVFMILPERFVLISLDINLIDCSEAPSTPGQVTAMTELIEETPERRIIRSHAILGLEEGGGTHLLHTLPCLKNRVSFLQSSLCLSMNSLLPSSSSHTHTS